MFQVRGMDIRISSHLVILDNIRWWTSIDGYKIFFIIFYFFITTNRLVFFSQYCPNNYHDSELQFNFVVCAKQNIFMCSGLKLLSMVSQSDDNFF